MFISSVWMQQQQVAPATKVSCWCGQSLVECAWDLLSTERFRLHVIINSHRLKTLATQLIDNNYQRGGRFTHNKKVMTAHLLYGALIEPLTVRPICANKAPGLRYKTSNLNKAFRLHDGDHDTAQNFNFLLVNIRWPTFHIRPQTQLLSSLHEDHVGWMASSNEPQM